jgi:hypothetical protein
MKNIAIGINIFGNTKRHQLCIDSLVRLKNKHENVNLYNIQQQSQRNVEIHPLFETIYDNGRTAVNSVEGCSMRMPMVKDFFDALAETNNEYFIFLNSDIILTSKIVKFINANDVDTVSMSRLAIKDIDSLDDANIEHSHFQIAGFDVWAVKTSWWLENRMYFPDYIYAISAWDVDYGARMMVLGNSKFDIDFPPGCYHIIHPEKSHDNTPERAYNMKLFFQDNKLLCDAWHEYLYSMIDRRGKKCSNYTLTTDGEDTLIKTIFKDENLYTFCSN